MQHLSATTIERILRFTWRGALLLALGAAGVEARGQSFGPMIPYLTSASGNPQEVVLADMNGNGRLDLVAANSSITSAFSILTGQANGIFSPFSGYAMNGSADRVAVGDVNGDGRPDVVTINNSQLGILLAQATGGFGAATYYYLGFRYVSHTVVLSDVNGDGRLDVVTASQTDGLVSVLLNQTGGGFGNASQYSTGTNSLPERVAVGDVNSDGRPDIVVANQGSNTIGVLLGRVGGGFASIVLYPTGANSSPVSVVLNDRNGDGRLDIMMANYAAGTVGVLLAQATVGFAAPVFYPVGPNSGPVSMAMGDLNGDGYLDVATANYNANSISVLLGQRGGSFSTATSYATGTGSLPTSVALGDVNGDGRPDIAVANSGSQTAGVFLNVGTYTPLAAARPAAADLTLAPNPAHDAFTVQLLAGAAPGPAELLNTLGQVVRRLPPAGPRFTIETAGLAPGIYTLRVGLGAATVARRVVVE